MTLRGSRGYCFLETTLFNSTTVTSSPLFIYAGQMRSFEIIVLHLFQNYEFTEFYLHIHYTVGLEDMDGRWTETNTSARC